jgi:hypothetical protein
MQLYEDSSCSAAGPRVFFQREVCIQMPWAPGKSFYAATDTDGAGVGSTPSLVMYATTDCSGTPDNSYADIQAGVGFNTCEDGTSNAIGTYWKIEQAGWGDVDRQDLVSGYARKRIRFDDTECGTNSEGAAITQIEHLLISYASAAGQEIDQVSCQLTGLGDGPFKYVKWRRKDYHVDSASRYIFPNGNKQYHPTWMTESYYSDAGCTELSWSSPPSAYQGCVTSKVGVGPDFTCTTAPCATSYPTTGRNMAVHYNQGINTNFQRTVNYAKFRFFQDSSCTNPTTYINPEILAIEGRGTYNGANHGQTGVLNTAGTYFQAGEQVYDGNALGQVMYLPVDTATNAAVCTTVELGLNGAVGSIECTLGVGTRCETFASTDCTGSPLSQANCTKSTWTDCKSDGIGFLPLATQAKSDCISNIFAKIESFATGVEWTGNQLQQMQFAEPGAGELGLTGSPRLAEECGGTPIIMQGFLDVCQVDHKISHGATWNSPIERARCSDSWDTQYAAATFEPTVAACKARCTSNVDCLAVSFGRYGAGSGDVVNNHKCVLCKDVTTAGHTSWDTYVKDVTAPFVKISRGNSANTFKTTWFTTSDCTGVGVETDMNHIMTCRSSQTKARGAPDNRLGSIMLTTGFMTSLQFQQTLDGEALVNGPTLGSITDQIGCPDTINYVFTEGEYDIGTGNGFNNNRHCSVLFQGPVGTTISFDWTSFALTTTHGSCSGTPAECICDGQEGVTIRDGIRDTSRQVGQTMCGTFSPARMLFSGNTARLDVKFAEQSSTFRVWVSFHETKVNLHLPPNPAYALGSDISIPYSVESSVAGWEECDTGAHESAGMHGAGMKQPVDEQWQRRFNCARSPASDHGWIGIYKNGTCEDGPMLAHEITDAHSVHSRVHRNKYAKNQQPHECYLGYRTIPYKETRGTVIFKFGEDYKDAGYYSLRYFSGDSAGTVCEVLPDSKATDPAELKNMQCLYSPISRAEIFVTGDRFTYSGATGLTQLPGYEVTINY